MADSFLYGILHCLLWGSKNGNSKERLVRHFALFALGIKEWQFKGSSLQSLLVQQETFAIPFEQFYLLAVLGEEDEYRTTKWRKFHLGSHNLIQTVYAHVHSDISLADVILGIFV